MRRISAVLFDLDGVLVESKEATERVWLGWALANGIGEDELRSAMHGVRSVEVVRALRPGLDSVLEAEAIERRQAEDLRGVRAIPGAAAAMRALREDRVAVVTSATRPLAAARLGAAGIELPSVVVYADDVTRGKPDPEGYLTAASRLGVQPSEALVVEDAPPGIEAGRAAGAATVGVVSTHAGVGALRGRRGDRDAGGAAGRVGAGLRCAFCAAGERRALKGGSSVGLSGIAGRSDRAPPWTGSFTAVVNVGMTTNVPGFSPMDGDGPRFGAMIGLVAVVVATVILVFFGIGYALGRLFL